MSDIPIARCSATLGVLIALNVGCGDSKSGSGSRVVDGGDEAGQCPTSGGCSAYETRFATFELPCSHFEDATVEIYGQCNVEKDVLGAKYVFSSPSPGVCSVSLIFGTGFTYSTNLTFAWQTPSVPHGCPACPAYIGPTGLPSNPTTIGNPATICREAGPDAPSDAEQSDGKADAANDATSGSTCSCPSGDAGGTCVCKSFSLSACPSGAATSASCDYSGTCMGCSEGAGFTCACSDAGAPVPDGGGPQWICIGTGEACTGGGP